MCVCIIYIQMFLRNWLLKNRQKVSGEDFPKKNGYRTDVSCPELRFGDGCEELHWWSSELHLGRTKGRHPGARCEDYGWSIEKILEIGSSQICNVFLSSVFGILGKCLVTSDLKSWIEIQKRSTFSQFRLGGSTITVSGVEFKFSAGSCWFELDAVHLGTLPNLIMRLGNVEYIIYNI